jgi:hypothetical protein
MAAPQPEKSDQAPKAASPAPAGARAKPAGPPAAAKPARNAGSFVSRLFFSIVLLLMLLGVAGYGALMLRDADPRVGVAADYVDKGLTEAKGLFAGLTGETPKTESPRPGRPTLEKAPLAAQEPAPASPDAAREPEPSAEAPTPEAPAKPSQEAVEVKPEETKPVEAVKPEAAKPVEAPVEARPVEVPPPAVATPAPAPTPVAKAESRDADGFTDRDLISALEGRIDALGDEIRSLRERLDAPKNETRAAPEAEAPKPAATSDASAAAVVLAFALQRELEAGRPFAPEIAAFSRLATTPAPAPVLIELSEKGAPTGPALREAFLPISKKLRAQESHAESGALAEHLLQGASKLVKVRPTGEPLPETIDGKLDRILAALAHNDFDAAASQFDSLPEAARAETGDFGARLNQRREAAKAADELLSGSIAALGKK